MLNKDIKIIIIPFLTPRLSSLHSIFASKKYEKYHKNNNNNSRMYLQLIRYCSFGIKPDKTLA
ncbi:MAG TPA: hypothetical protein VH500_16825 [Nitrososphaeraceae archaeon]